MRRIDAAVAVASTLLIALTVWMAVQVRNATPPATAMERQSMRVAAPTRPPAATPARPLRPRPAAKMPPAPGSVEVCGLGDIQLPVPTREAEAAVHAALIEPVARRQREQLVAVLDASGSEQERALGHFLARIDHEDREARREALATLALHSSDGGVYRLALVACKDSRLEASQCDRLSNEQWARLDADNAMPWLALADEASRRGDGEAVAEALFRASRARRFDTDSTGPARVMQRADVQGLPTLERLALLTHLFGIWAAMPWPGLSMPMEYCRHANADPNRPQLCADLATLFIERDDNLIGFMTGIKLAEHAGWSDERRQRLADEADALWWAMQQQLPAADEPGYSCEWWRHIERHTADVAGKNELGALHERIVESGRGIAELAKARRAARSEAFAAASAKDR